MKFEELKTKIESYFSEANQVKRIVIYAAIALGLAIVSFSGYYYWDRYVKLGDETPISRSINELEDLVRQHPDDPELRMALAESYLVDQNYAKAMEQADFEALRYIEMQRTFREWKIQREGIMRELIETASLIERIAGKPLFRLPGGK